MTIFACLLALSMPLFESKTIESGGYKWEYEFAQPAGKARGLILAMHGGGGSGSQFDASSGWTKKGVAAGFAVVVPSGQPIRPGVVPNFTTNPRVWNSGQLPDRSPRTKISDMAMLDALIGKCLKDVGDVPIFVSGHSNGSGMSFRFAKESSRRVVAMGVVSGTKAVETPGKLKGSIPTLYIAGEKDPITPWEGGRTKTPWGEKESPAVLKMMDDWATWQGLKVPAEKNPASGGVVTYRYGDVVEVRCVLGHGHAWPGAKADSVAVERAMGPNVAKFDATREILAWFESALR